MPSIFKRKKDRGKSGTSYVFEYTDHLGRRRREKGFPDKAETMKLAAEREHQCNLRRKGLIDVQEEESKRRKQTSIEQHLLAFEKSISRGDNTADYAQMTVNRVRRIVDEAGIEKAADIDYESVEQVLTEWIESGVFGRKTYNHYLQAMDQFCKWLCHGQRKILTSNPIEGMRRLNTEVDVRHPRRALKPEEFALLVQSARASDKSIQCFTGEDRARIYLTSFFTGLRRKEIASLTPRSFDLEASPPTVTVDAACSKHKRKDVLPLHDDFVAMLGEWLSDIEPDQVLFPHLAKRRTWRMVKLDLESVGIPYETNEGIADFHAAGRHTHITELLRNGVSLPQARELARQSDVRTTMKYTHIGIDDQAKAVQRLPSSRFGLQTNGDSVSHSGQHPNVSDGPAESEKCQKAIAEPGASTKESQRVTAEMPPMNGIDPKRSKTQNGFDSRRLH